MNAIADLTIFGRFRHPPDIILTCQLSNINRAQIVLIRAKNCGPLINCSIVAAVSLSVQRRPR